MSLALLPNNHSQEGQMEIKTEIFLASGNLLLLFARMSKLFLNRDNLGITAFAIANILGITSLPSVTKALTWKEFAFVQSKLGWFCLLLGWAHDFSYGWPRTWFGNESCWGTLPHSGNVRTCFQSYSCMNFLYKCHYGSFFSVCALYS